MLPPFVVLSKTLPAPTIQPTVVFTNLMELYWLVYADDCGNQVAPLFVVAMIVPSSPQAHPFKASIKKILRIVSVVPEVCSVQLTPPSVVFSITPFAPATQPLDKSINFTVLNATVTGRPEIGV